MKKPLVIGHKGEIGSFLVNGLLKYMDKALDILCFDVNETQEEVEERIKKSDVIFLCVPVKQTVNWLKTYKSLLSGKIIFEQASLKEWVYEQTSKDNLDLRSMHILFRPSGTPNLSDRRVALFKNQFNISTAITPEEISKITKSQIVWFTSIKEHDQEMAVQQALLHRTLLTLGELISKGTGRTYISQKILELCDRIKAGDSELYEFIQQNRHVSDALKDFSDNLKNFDIHKFFPL